MKPAAVAALAILLLLPTGLSAPTAPRHDGTFDRCTLADLPTGGPVLVEFSDEDAVVASPYLEGGNGSADRPWVLSIPGCFMGTVRFSGIAANVTLERTTFWYPGTTAVESDRMANLTLRDLHLHPTATLLSATDSRVRVEQAPGSEPLQGGGFGTVDASLLEVTGVLWVGLRDGLQAADSTVRMVGSAFLGDGAFCDRPSLPAVVEATLLEGTGLPGSDAWPAVRAELAARDPVLATRADDAFKAAAEAALALPAWNDVALQTAGSQEVSDRTFLAATDTNVVLAAGLLAGFARGLELTGGQATVAAQRFLCGAYGAKLAYTDWVSVASTWDGVAVPYVLAGAADLLSGLPTLPAGCSPYIDEAYSQGAVVACQADLGNGVGFDTRWEYVAGGRLRDPEAILDNRTSPPPSDPPAPAPRSPSSAGRTFLSVCDAFGAMAPGGIVSDGPVTLVAPGFLLPVVQASDAPQAWATGLDPAATMVLPDNIGYLGAAVRPEGCAVGPLTQPASTNALPLTYDLLKGDGTVCTTGGVPVEGTLNVPLVVLRCDGDPLGTPPTFHFLAGLPPTGPYEPLLLDAEVVAGCGRKGSGFRLHAVAGIVPEVGYNYRVGCDPPSRIEPVFNTKCAVFAAPFDTQVGNIRFTRDLAGCSPEMRPPLGFVRFDTPTTHALRYGGNLLVLSTELTAEDTRFSITTDGDDTTFRIVTSRGLDRFQLAVATPSTNLTWDVHASAPESLQAGAHAATVGTGSERGVAYQAPPGNRGSFIGFAFALEDSTTTLEVEPIQEHVAFRASDTGTADARTTKASLEGDFTGRQAAVLEVHGPAKIHVNAGGITYVQDLPLEAAELSIDSAVEPDPGMTAAVGGWSIEQASNGARTSFSAKALGDAFVEHLTVNGAVDLDFQQMKEFAVSDEPDACNRVFVPIDTRRVSAHFVRSGDFAKATSFDVGTALKGRGVNHLKLEAAECAMDVEANLDDDSHALLELGAVSVQRALADEVCTDGVTDYPPYQAEVSGAPFTGLVAGEPDAKESGFPYTLSLETVTHPRTHPCALA